MCEMEAVLVGAVFLGAGQDGSGSRVGDFVEFVRVTVDLLQDVADLRNQDGLDVHLHLCNADVLVVFVERFLMLEIYLQFLHHHFSVLFFLFLFLFLFIFPFFSLYMWVITNFTTKPDPNAIPTIRVNLSIRKFHHQLIPPLIFHDHHKIYPIHLHPSLNNLLLLYLLDLLPVPSQQIPLNPFFDGGHIGE